MTIQIIRCLVLAALGNIVCGELVDLSHSYDDETLMWRGGAKFHFTKQRRGTPEKWYAANDYETAEHSGTHLDAPFHFCKDGKTVGQIPLNKLFTKGVIVNASVEAGGKWDYTLPTSVLQAWEKQNGEIPENSVVLVDFGWGYKYPNKSEYMGPSDKYLRFPGLSIEAAHWLIDTKKVVGVGLDTASIDASKAEGAPVHRLLCSQDIYILENVALSGKTLPPIVDLIILPMKIKEGTGAPVRIVAKL